MAQRVRPPYPHSQGEDITWLASQSTRLLHGRNVTSADSASRTASSPALSLTHLDRVCESVVGPQHLGVRSCSYCKGQTRRNAGTQSHGSKVRFDALRQPGLPVPTGRGSDGVQSAPFLYFCTGLRSAAEPIAGVRQGGSGHRADVFSTGGEAYTNAIQH